MVDDKYIKNFAKECFTQIYRAFYGDAMFVLLGGAQKSETSVVELCY